MTEHHGSVHALGRLLGEVEQLLKHPSVAVELGRAGVNASIALLAVQGVAAYVQGNEVSALDDLGTAVDEIRARRQRR